VRVNQIEVRHASKTYRVADRRPVLTVDLLRLLTFRGLGYRDVVALKDVSFEVERGEAFGVIGNNGSGKSTLLRMLAGVTVPTSGEVRVNGTVASMLELGAGFHPDLTGRENVWLSGALIGLSRSRIRSKFDEIVAFAEIEPFIDQPLFTYSSGMQVRLGFAVSIAHDPDVLILDEVLAVGDQGFRDKSHAAILDFRKRGKTIILVSHDLHEVVGFCGRALLLNEGSPVLVDEASKVVPFYVQTAGAKGGQQYVNAGRLSLAFSSGRLLLFRDGIPLTQFFGFYFSVFIARNWFDSVQANWHFTHESPSGFVAEGTFSTLPLTAVLETEVRSESEVRVVLRGRVTEPVSVDQYHASLLVQPRYARWGAGPEEGTFPPIDVASHEWVHVNHRPLRGRRLEVRAAGELPGVALISDTGDFAPTVLNTDHAANARVLQFLAPAQQRWEPGEHVLFSGRITIDDAETAR
jgi:ABC-type polysaccharide/polyol phosphate transport system ATPase subunit